MSIQAPDIKPEKKQLEEQTKYGLGQLENWLKNGINKESVDFCEKFGFCLSRFTSYNRKGEPKVKSLSSNQIRKVYGEIKRIEMKLGESMDNWSKYRSEFLLLKPKMAYSAKRDKTFPAECLYKILSASINIIDTIEDEKKRRQGFKNFCALFEAIIAYHRAFEN